MVLNTPFRFFPTTEHIFSEIFPTKLKNFTLNFRKIIVLFFHFSYTNFLIAHYNNALKGNITAINRTLALENTYF